MEFKNGYLPLNFRFVLVGIGFVGLAVLTSNVIIGVLMIIFGVIMYFAHQGAELDVSGKRYREYVSIAGLKFGTWYNYQSIEKLYLNKVNTSQVMQSARTTTSSVIRGVSYRLYLKFDDGETLMLSDEKKKSLAEERVERILERMVIDYSDNTL